MNLQGHKELLGLWLAESEGAKFWLSCLIDLKNRGLRDILGHKGATHTFA